MWDEELKLCVATGDAAAVFEDGKKLGIKIGEESVLGASFCKSSGVRWDEELQSCVPSTNACAKCTYLGSEGK